MTKIDFGGIEETVITRDEFPLEKAQKVLKNEVIAVLGYGSQGPGQSLNLRDNGFNVIVGQRKLDNGKVSNSYQKALDDGWIPGETLFDINEAAKKATIIEFLLSDAGQKVAWPQLEKCIEDGNTLYFSHGFSLNFPQYTRVTPPANIDVVLVAPKGAGRSVRTNFLNGGGINSSFAVHQDYTGSALEKTLALGIGIGSGFLFETTVRNEVVSDLTGERAVLLGELWALAEASYDALRQQGYSPEDAFIQSSEQITQVILPLIGRSGSVEIYEQTISAKQYGSVSDHQRITREVTRPLMEQLYRSVVSGIETQRSLEANSRNGYRDQLNSELSVIDNSEMWLTGEKIRAGGGDRTYGLKITNFPLAGAVLGIMESQYQTFIDHGHKPSEAFNETVEEATQSLNQFYQLRGAAHLLRVCSTTAQRGSLDWGPVFKKFLSPIFRDLSLYGKFICSPPDKLIDYTLTNPNMWVVGQEVRKLRPENQRIAA